MTLIDRQNTFSYRWEHPLKKRFYFVCIHKDLFNDIVLTMVWGGINKANGRITNLPCKNYDEAFQLVEKIGSVRLKRGYIPCKT